MFEGAPGKVSWRRRARHWASRLGARRLARRLADVGAVLITRSSRARRKKLNQTTWLVHSHDSPVSITRVGAVGWFVGEKSGSPRVQDKIEKAVLTSLGEQHVVSNLDRYGVDVVIDVGANRGQYARSLRARGYTGEIASFEPVPEYFARLEKAAAADPAWTVHQMALGAEHGSLPMHVQRTLSSLLDSTDFGRERFTSLREFDGDEPIEVPVRRLDAVLDDVLEPVRRRGIENPRIYLKLDTQGFDLQAFAGLGDRASDVVAMQSEVALILIYEGMPRMPEAVATYEAAGFEISGLFPITRQPDGRVIEFDCMMVRPEALPT